MWFKLESPATYNPIQSKFKPVHAISSYSEASWGLSVNEHLHSHCNPTVNRIGISDISASKLPGNIKSPHRPNPQKSLPWNTINVEEFIFRTRSWHPYTPIKLPHKNSVYKYPYSMIILRFAILSVNRITFSILQLPIWIIQDAIRRVCIW